MGRILASPSHEIPCFRSPCSHFTAAGMPLALIRISLEDGSPSQTGPQSQQLVNAAAGRYCKRCFFGPSTTVKKMKYGCLL